MFLFIQCFSFSAKLCTKNIDWVGILYKMVRIIRRKKIALVFPFDLFFFFEKMSQSFFLRLRKKNVWSCLVLCRIFFTFSFSNRTLDFFFDQWISNMPNDIICQLFLVNVQVYMISKQKMKNWTEIFCFVFFSSHIIVCKNTRPTLKIHLLFIAGTSCTPNVLSKM